MAERSLSDRLRGRLRDLAGNTEAGAGATGEAEVDTQAAVGTPLSPRPNGPYDLSEVTKLSGYVDLGALLVPGRSDVTFRVTADDIGAVDEVVVAHDGSTMRLEVFAAPRTEGLWGQVSTQVVAGLEADGHDTVVTHGPFGAQVCARLTTETGPRQLRVIGVDGPGWLLRATIQGPSPAQPADGEDTGDGVETPPAGAAPVGVDDVAEFTGPLAEVFTALVVRRGRTPHPAGARLPFSVDPSRIGRPPADVAVETASRFAHLPGIFT